METDNIKQLFERFIEDKHSAEDFHAIQEFFQRKSDRQTLLELISRELQKEVPADFDQHIDSILVKTDERIFAELSKPNRKLSSSIWVFIRAAAAIVLIGIGSVLYFSNKNLKVKGEVAELIRPGRNLATIIDGNGKEIPLSEKHSGVSIRNGLLSYANGDSLPHSAGTLRARTPRGGIYRFTLPDGTLVWLNAASQITFPSAFNRNNRTVELSGEAYFQVAKDRTRPFIVKSQTQTIQVLGTHFNVSAYQKETVRTTLLEGSVAVKVNGTVKNAKTIQLKPGEQSLIVQQQISVQQVDTEPAIAWKNGQFAFNDESLELIMLKIARWYDVEVQYNGVDKSLKFWGGISRYERIEKVLQKLELTGGVHFKIEGRRIMVSK